MNISNKKVLRNGIYTEIAPTVYRKADALEIKGSFTGQTASIVLKISHYQDEARTLEDSTFAEERATLVIDNTTLVDKRTGQYATVDTPAEFAEGEFDFFLTQKLGNIEEMINMGIARADALNRFD